MLDNRLLCELALLEDYKKSHTFLREYKIVDDDPLKIEFRLVVKHRSYLFVAIFSRYFPYLPIQIIAKTEFFSSHSYKNGAMCLKYGQDNWNKEITFVSLIENLYELLFTENPLGKKHQESESGDLFTFGQQLRRMGKYCVLLPYGLDQFVSKEGYLECLIKNGDFDSYTFVVSDINNHHLYSLKANKLKIKFHILPFKRSEKEIEEVKKSTNYSEKENTILFFNDGYAELYLVEVDNPRPIIARYLTKEYEIKKRIQIDDSTLQKRITIVGLGSVGSRVAVDLARAGFKHFHLVDDDVLLPYNVIRHELTNFRVGEYKVNAIRDLISQEINNDADVEVSTLAMTGQESSTSTSRFIKNCSESSLIIDCTADDSILFMLSKMTSEKNIPVISGTVIPGGLGNIVLVKKTKDVDLESLLASYYKWQSEKIIFAEKVDDYTSSINDQTFSATMSDCSILSGFIGKFAIDILQGKESHINNINIFSTSDYCSLNEFYHTYKIDANMLNKTEEQYDEELIKNGKTIYENYCSKRNNK